MANCNRFINYIKKNIIFLCSVVFGTTQYYTTIVKKSTERLRLEEMTGELIINEYYWQEIEREMMKYVW
ncbi:MAG: hypothetical protein ACP5U0_10500 [Caldisphaera sp.]